MDQQDRKSELFKLAKTYFQENFRDGSCYDDDILMIFCTIAEIFFLIALSHIFHLVLKRLDQPSIVSQMLSGFFLGPTILGHFNLLDGDKNSLNAIVNGSRIFFMFLAGVEIDISYLKRMLRFATMITGGSMATCFLLSIVVRFWLIHSSGSRVAFVLMVFLVLFNTSSPVLIQLVNELKITMTETGRLAISSALVMDIVCLVMLAVLDFASVEQEKLGRVELGPRLISGIMVLTLLVGVAFGVRSTVKRVNRWNVHKRFVGDDVVFYFLLLVFGTCMSIEFMGYDPMIGAFIFGLVIQRDGPTARTIVEQLTYIVHNFILPLYFGAAVLRVDFDFLMYKEVVSMAVVVMFLGMVAKMSGTMGVATYMGLPKTEGVLLSFLLNIRGHVDLMVIALGKKIGMWSDKTYMALLIALFFNSLTAYPVISYIVRRERQMVRYRSKGLEWLNPESELRILACIHSPSDVPAMLGLIEISRSPDNRHLSPYILHLTELTCSATSTMLYHQFQDNDSDNDMLGNHAQQVCVAVDRFIRETNIHVHQLNAVSPFDTMHKDLEHMVQNVHASLAILPFHCKQRFDGKMGVGKVDIQKFNRNVLHHVPCSIGILVDRGLGRRKGSSALIHNPSLSSNLDKCMLLTVMVMFMGGPDDREAVAYAARLALLPWVKVTVVRILPAFRQGAEVYLCSSSVPNESLDIAMEVEGDDTDEIFMSNFYNRFVVTGTLTYVERLVENSAELITILSSMAGMYSLCIVGRRVQGPISQLTMGMSDWEEYPELGSIGDVLASSDFMLTGSVLVIQQQNTIS